MCPECRRTSHTWHFEAGKGLVIRHGFLLCLLYMSFELRFAIQPCSSCVFARCLSVHHRMLFAAADIRQWETRHQQQTSVRHLMYGVTASTGPIKHAACSGKPSAAVSLSCCELCKHFAPATAQSVCACLDLKCCCTCNILCWWGCCVGQDKYGGRHSSHPTNFLR